MSAFETLYHQNCFAPTAAERQTAATELEARYNCEINCVEIDPSVRFAHHARGCTVIASKLGANVIIFQNVTIGSNMAFNRRTQAWEHLGNPVIGANVKIADGAKVLGPIIIGENTVIGAGAIITKDVPANSVAYGVNQVKPRDPDKDLLFHQPMPDGEALVQACRHVIRRAEE